MNKKYVNKLIEEHWSYTQEIMELMYKKAGKHFYKHGYIDGKKK